MTRTSRTRPPLGALAALVRSRLLGTWGWRLGCVGALAVLLAGAWLASLGAGQDPGELALDGHLPRLLSVAGVLLGAGPLAWSVARGGAELTPALQALARSRGACPRDFGLGSWFGASALFGLLLVLPWGGLALLASLEVQGGAAAREVGAFLLVGVGRSLGLGGLLGAATLATRRLPLSELVTLLVLLPLVALLGGLP